MCNLFHKLNNYYCLADCLVHRLFDTIHYYINKVTPPGGAWDLSDYHKSVHVIAMRKVHSLSLVKYSNIYLSVHTSVIVINWHGAKRNLRRLSIIAITIDTVTWLSPTAMDVLTMYRCRISHHAFACCEIADVRKTGGPQIIGKE